MYQKRNTTVLPTGSPFSQRKRRRFFLSLCLLIFLSALPTLSNAQYTFGTPQGNASRLSGPYYQITPAQMTQRGAIWSTGKVDLDDTLEFTFYANFGTNTTYGGDGMVFVLQNHADPSSNTVLGGTGGRIGYAAGNGSTTGITQSLCIEFDTYFNPTVDNILDLGTSSASETDHIDILANGVQWNTLTNSTATLLGGGPVQASPYSTNIEDGDCHKIKVRWLPDNTTPANSVLEVYFDNMSTPRCTLVNDIRSYINSTDNTCWWGITGATQNAINKQYIAYLDIPDLDMCAGSQLSLGNYLDAGTGESYSWTPSYGLSCTSCSNPTATPALSTYYQVTMSYPNHCTIEDGFTINVNRATVDLGPDKFASCGLPTQLSATVTPSNHTMSYSWSPATGLSCSTCANPTATLTSTTTYTLTITDQQTGCTATDNITLYVNPFTIDLGPNVTNCGQAVTLSPTLYPNQAVTYSWWSVPAGFSSTASQVTVTPTSTPTTYYVKVTNSGGCSDTDFVTVKSNGFTMNSWIDFADCKQPVQLGLTPIPAQTDPLTYNWTSGSWSSTSAQPVVSEENTQTYYLTVTNTVTGCTATASYTVVRNPVSITADTDKTICVGEQVQLNNTYEATPSPTFAWTPSAGLSCTTCLNPVANPTATTLYTVTVTNQYGCTATDQVLVTVLEKPQIEPCDTPSICLGECIQLKVKNAAIPEGSTYSWTPATGLSDPTALEPMACPKVSTTYTLVINSPGGCNASISVPVNVGGLAGAPFEKDYTFPDINSDFQSINKTPDCGIITSGAYVNDFYVVKTDGNGFLNWAKRYNRGTASSAEDIEPYFSTNECTRNEHDGYAIAGYSKSSTCVDFDFHLYTINPQGGVKNTLILGTQGPAVNNKNTEYAKDIQPTTDNGFIALGYTESFGAGGFDMYVAKTNRQLQLSWAYTFGGAGNETGIGVLECSDGGYLLVGSTNGSFSKGQNNDIYIVKITQNGTHSWSRIYGGAGNDYGHSALEFQGPNGPEYLITGSSTSTGVWGTSDVVVLNVSSTGNLLWSKRVGSARSEGVAGVKASVDNRGNLILTSSTSSQLGCTWCNDVCIFSLDRNANFINFQSMYRNPANDIHDVPTLPVVFPDRTFAFAGTTYDFVNNTGYDPFIIRTDGAGSTKCKHNPGFTVSNITLNAFTVPSVRQLHNEEINDTLYAYTVTPMVMDVCQPGFAKCVDFGGGISLTTDPNLPVTPTVSFGSDLNLNTNYPSFVPGDYALVYHANMVKPYWDGMDHSGDGSGILVSQGPLLTGDARAWYQPVMVQPGHMYLFCIWAKNICPTCPENPRIELRTGGLQGDIVAAETELLFQDGWVNIAGLYEPTTSGMLELDVITKAIQGGSMGADFALDDIYFIDVTGIGSLAPAVTSIGENSKSTNALKLYPNPVQTGDIIHLEYSVESAGQSSIRIVDATGRLVRDFVADSQAGLNNYDVQTSGMSAGVYLVQIQVGTQTYNQLVIVRQ